MRVLSLFAGIGGFDLGLERAGMTTVGQCEIDLFCQKVLAKHWPKVWRHDDVRTLTAELVRANCGTVDVICGGFPCQDISLAGPRTGMGGARSGLWSEYARLVCELRPKFVIVENVPGLLIPTHDGEPAPIARVLGDLAECGYDAAWERHCSCQFGTPHCRARIWIVAYPREKRAEGFIGLGIGIGKNRQGRAIDASFMCDWPEHWEVEGFGAGEASALIRGDDDGIPNRLDRVGALGNAIVPQIAEFIGRQLMSLPQA